MNDQCRSVFAWANYSSAIDTARCLEFRGHTGQCRDGYGHTWTRVDEWLRMAREVRTW